MQERAIRERWPIPDEARPQVVGRLVKVVAKSKSDREAIAASRALISADKLNLEQEKLDRMEQGGEASGETIEVDLSDEASTAGHQEDP